MRILILIMVILFTGCKPLKEMEEEAGKITSMKIENIDFSKLGDGIYRGKCEFKMVKAEVEVVIKSGKLESVKIVKHEKMMGKPAEKITERVKEKQSLQVDVVAGATYRSKVILKAIENSAKQFKIN